MLTQYVPVLIGRRSKLSWWQRQARSHARRLRHIIGAKHHWTWDITSTGETVGFFRCPHCHLPGACSSVGPEHFSGPLYSQICPDA